MLTQCPGCQTTFRVTGAILRAARGQVRCGRCNTQFDAIEYLQEEEPAIETVPEQTPEYSATFDQRAAQHEEITLEGTRIEISGIYRNHQAADQDEAAEHTRTVVQEFNIDNEEWQNPFIASAEQPSAEEAASAAALSRALASLDSDESDTPPQPEIVPFTSVPTKRAATAQAVAGSSPAYARQARVVSDEMDADDDATAEYHPESELASPTRTQEPIASTDDAFTELVDKTPATRRWPWVVASCMLIVLLAAQLLHHYRQTLVRHPTFGPPLQWAYAHLGLTLEPSWELGAYSIKQWGIVSDPQVPGTLRVRAGITNHADFAQPYPLLKLTLEDRFGATLGAREFKPEEYLPSPSTTRRLAAGAAASVDLAIVDLGQEAIGFQFNVCLQHGDGLECTG